LTITVEVPYIQNGITKTVEDSKTIKINIEKRIKQLKTNIKELKLYYKINQNGVLEFSLNTHLRYLGYSEENEPIVIYIDKCYNDFTEPINHLDYFSKFIRVKGVILKVEDYYIIKSKFSDNFF
jgi:hypothetical protein